MQAMTGESRGRKALTFSEMWPWIALWGWSRVLGLLPEGMGHWWLGATVVGLGVFLLRRGRWAHGRVVLGAVCAGLVTLALCDVGGCLDHARESVAEAERWEARASTVEGAFHATGVAQAEALRAIASGSRVNAREQVLCAVFLITLGAWVGHLAHEASAGKGSEAGTAWLDAPGLEAQLRDARRA